MILGIDEVGRGPWAGPLVVGAVVLGDASIPGLTDSKKLTAKKREALNAEIIEKASGWGLGWVHANELDTIGLAEALKLATIRAVEAIKVPYHEIILDGTINFLKDTHKGRYVTTMAKADLLVPAVSAASIIAKVARDSFMAEQDALYKGYGFGSHVGYGTAAHRLALQNFGVTPLHRKSFAPIAKLIGDERVGKPAMKPRAALKGGAGEDKAATYLEASGHTIIARNWKNKYCEIDIISSMGDTLFFTEVKYRTSKNQGGAVAAITPRKLEQMKFAAEMYLHSIKANQRLPTPATVQLAALTLDGNSLQFLEVL